MPETLASFRGTVRCERSSRAHTLTLSGTSAQGPGEEIALILSASTAVECPHTLEDAVVEQLTGQQYRIRSVAGEWLVEAEAAHLHREVAGAFYRAILPRPAPWRKRLFWRIVLTLAATRSGLAALRMLRRQV
ncbi:MAG TPA: hypothetical protein VKT19_06950 [Steroidobacteraceae bacterium]|nr:hypothetical protein [Steroidobacteraceae bacterium]